MWVQLVRVPIPAQALGPRRDQLCGHQHAVERPQVGAVLLEQRLEVFGVGSPTSQPTPCVRQVPPGEGEGGVDGHGGLVRLDGGFPEAALEAVLAVQEKAQRIEITGEPGNVGQLLAEHDLGQPQRERVAELLEVEPADGHAWRGYNQLTASVEHADVQLDGLAGGIERGVGRIAGPQFGGRPLLGRHSWSDGRRVPPRDREARRDDSDGREQAESALDISRQPAPIERRLRPIAHLDREHGEVRRLRWRGRGRRVTLSRAEDEPRDDHSHEYQRHRDSSQAHELHSPS